MFVKMIDGSSLDSEFPKTNNKIKSLDITPAGVIEIREDNGGMVNLYPWHRIEFVMGTGKEGIRLSNEARS